MNTKGVEDGITDERLSAKQRVLAKYPKASWDSIMGVWPNDSTGLKGCLGIGPTEMEAWDSADRALAAFEPKPANQGSITEILHNVRSATPEELTAQRESYGRNYKPGPRQAVPFLPSAAVPVEERTAEMRELMGRLRELATRATPGPWHQSYLQPLYVVTTNGPHKTVVSAAEFNKDGSIHSIFADDKSQAGEDVRFIAEASPENILRLLDHIEGKAKAVSQEVKE